MTTTQEKIAAPTAVRAPKRASNRGWAQPARIVGSGIALLVVWAVIAPFFPSFILPGPLDVWESFVSTVGRGVWVPEVFATLSHLASAFVLDIVIGLPLGILIGRSRIFEDLTRVPLIILQTTPTIVIISVILIGMGISDLSVIVVATLGSITFFLLNVIQGTRAVDQDFLDMARAYRANESTVMRTVILPSVVPYFLAGARITIGVAWHITLFAEYIMGSSGVGYQINTAIKLLDMPAVFMWGLSVVALTILVEYGVFRPTERYLTRHQKGRLS